nr:RNA-directed DNA polymerase [Tanacetum cinerariifolium]
DPPCLVSYDRVTSFTTEADGKRRDVEFDVGDLVYLKLRPYHQVSVAKWVNQKLSPRYYGLFAMVEQIGRVAYRLQLPVASSIHTVFHVSQLKRIIGDHQVVCDLLDGLVTKSPLVLVDVYGSRLDVGRGKVLIAWKDMPESKATLEGFEEVHM